MRRTTSPGETLQQRLREPTFVDRRYVSARTKPVSPVGGPIALFGSLAPRGAIHPRKVADCKGSAFA